MPIWACGKFQLLQNHRKELSPLGVRATSGTLRLDEGVVLQHVWTEQGVVAAPVANGAHVLHLSVALCVLNDTYREADRLGITVDGVAVDADGGFDEEWRSTGIAYEVTMDSQDSAEIVARLHAVVEDVAEIPRVIRTGTQVTRVGDVGRVDQVAVARTQRQTSQVLRSQAAPVMWWLQAVCSS